MYGSTANLDDSLILVTLARCTSARVSPVRDCTCCRGSCELAGVRHDVGPNEVLIIPAGVPHSYYAAAAEPWSIWWLHITGEDVPDLLAAIGLSVAEPTAPIA